MNVTVEVSATGERHVVEVGANDTAKGLREKVATLLCLEQKGFELQVGGSPLEDGPLGRRVMAEDVVTVEVSKTFLAVHKLRERDITPDHKAMTSAASNGQLDVIIELHQAGVEFEYPKGDYSSGVVPALQSAIHSGNKECVQLLVDLGADVNYEGEEDPPVFGCPHDDDEIYDMLLHHPKFDFESRNSEGMTPLLAAADDCCMRRIEKLVALGADLQAKVTTGCMTPRLGDYGPNPGANCVLVAAGTLHSNAHEVVEYFVQHGCDPNVVDDDGYTGLHYVGTSKTVELFVKKYNMDVNIKGRGGDTPLHNACMVRRTSTINKLVELGCDLNAQNDAGCTALMMSNDTYAEIAELLIDKGANMEVKDNLGMTAFMWAAYRRNIGGVLMLIKKGCDVHARDNRGHDALMLTVITEKAVTRRGSDPTATSFFEICALLTRLGLGGSATNNDGETVADIKAANTDYHQKPIPEGGEIDEYLQRIPNVAEYLKVESL